jgi:hypothetical protein
MTEVDEHAEKLAKLEVESQRVHKLEAALDRGEELALKSGEVGSRVLDGVAEPLRDREGVVVHLRVEKSNT